MIQKFKNIISLLMVLVLFMPLIVKLEHHHERFYCSAKGEKQFHTYHEKCAICCFEFSTFLSEKINIAFEKAEFANNYNCCLALFHFSDLSKYSFLLRGPPVFANNI
jgi:hypothetical protein